MNFRLLTLAGVCLLSLLAACGGGHDQSPAATPVASAPTVLRFDALATAPRLGLAGPQSLNGTGCSGIERSGWCQKGADDLGALDAFFLDAQRGWRVGHDGYIARTSDGGASWTLQTSPVAVSLRRVVFADDQEGMIFGDARALLVTHDGGAHWQLSRPDVPLEGEFLPARVDQLSASVAVAPGLVTLDGGQTWSVSDLAQVTRLGAQDFVATRGAYTVVRTTDAGKTWAPVLNLAAGSQAPEQTRLTLSGWGARNLLVMREYSPNREPDGSYTGSRQEVWMSQDAGASWTFSVVRATASDPYFPLLRLLWADAGGKTLLADSDSFGPYRSDDAGLHWRALRNDVPPVNSSVVLPNGHLLMLSCSSLAGCGLERSLDAGAHWASVSDAVALRALNWPSLSALGDAMALRQSTGALDLLLDEGHSRRSLVLDTASRQGTAQQRGSQWFLDASHGFAIDSDDHLNETLDGGASWRLKPSSVGPRGGPPVGNAPTRCEPLVRFNSATAGFARIREGSLFETTDGGNSWSYLGVDAWCDSAAGPSRAAERVQGSAGSTLAPNDVRVLASGRLVSGGRYSDDGGRTWMLAYTGTTARLGRVIQAPDDSLWAAGADATLMRSTDQGRSWTAVIAGGGPEIRDVFFLDRQLGWAVGDQGLVLVTRDGGATWARQDAGTERDLVSVQFVSATLGWIHGVDGLLLQTGTGGYLK